MGNLKKSNEIVNKKKVNKCVKDIINPYNCLSKNVIFFNQNNQWLNILHHILLNIQFTVVLDGINCISVWFCNNSPLVLKMRFQLFSFWKKRYKVFPVTGVSDFWNFNVEPIFLGNVRHIREINLLSLWNLIKAFYLPSKTNKKISRHCFVERLVKTIMAK